MERGPGIEPGRANIGTFLDNVQGEALPPSSVVIPSIHGRRINAGLSRLPPIFAPMSKAPVIRERLARTAGIEPVSPGTRAGSLAI